MFEKPPACSLARVEPEGAVKDLAWPDALALEAKGEGHVEVVCGSESINIKVVTPARLEIKLVDEGTPTHLSVNTLFGVQALLYDDRGRELEVGKFTTFDWTASDMFEVANDRSAGEFGFCDTCFGMHRFRATRPDRGWLSARLGALEGRLTVAAIE